MRHVLKFLIFSTLATSIACGAPVDKSSGKGSAKGETATNNEDSNNGGTDTNNTVTNNTTIVDVADPCIEVTPLSVSFGVVEVGNERQLMVDVENCSTTASLTFEGATTTDGFDVSLPTSAIEPGDSISVPLHFEPSDPVDYEGVASIITSAGAVAVTMTGAGTMADTGCPAAVARARVAPTEPWSPNLTAAVGETVFLNGTQSMANEEIVGYEWSIVSRPVDSAAALTNGSTAEPSIYLDAHGTYVLELRAFTETSPDDCGATQLTILAEDELDPDAYVMTLTWNTPGDPDQTDTSGTDLDLHYRIEGEAWNQAPYDSYWLNPDADWGEDGKVKVDKDDMDGAGPEQITHSYANPNGSYSIGVDFFSDVPNFGATTATVKIHRSGVLLLEKQRTLTQGQFWYLGDHVVALGVIQNDSVTDGFPEP